MEKRKYFVVYGDFGNQYNLFYTTDAGYYPENPSYCKKFTTADFLQEYPDAERITRAEAIRLARAERARRKFDPAFAGYADRYVYPYGAAWCRQGYDYLHTDSTSVIVE